MSTIKKAFKKSPLITALAVFLTSVSFCLAAVAVMNPELYPMIIQILSMITMFIGMLYLYVNRNAGSSVNPFGSPRLVVGVQIVINRPNHQLKIHQMTVVM